jgi:hypothetical protein
VDLAVKAIAMLELCHKAAVEAAAKGQVNSADADNVGACVGGEPPT